MQFFGGAKPARKMLESCQRSEPLVVSLPKFLVDFPTEASTSLDNIRWAEALAIPSRKDHVHSGKNLGVVVAFLALTGEISTT